MRKPFARLLREFFLKSEGFERSRGVRDGYYESSNSQTLEHRGHVRQTIKVALCSSFGPGWLIPRLNSFHELQGSYRLDLMMYTKDPIFMGIDADAYFTTEPLDLVYWSRHLFSEVLVAVAHPEVSLRAVMEGRVPLITTDPSGSNYLADWNRFLQATSMVLPGFNVKSAIGCSHYILAKEMARSGVGVALVPKFLCESDLRQGMLRKIFDSEALSGRDYFFSVKAANRTSPALQSLENWLESRLEADRNLDD